MKDAGKMGYPDRHVTVWEFLSIDGKERRLGIRPCYPDDYRFQHEYQRIVFRGPYSEYRVQGSKEFQSGSND